MNGINQPPAAPAPAPVTPRNQGIRQAAAPPAIDCLNRRHYPAIRQSLLTILRNKAARNNATRTDLPIRRFLNDTIQYQGLARPVAGFLGWNNMNAAEARIIFYSNNPYLLLGSQAVFQEGTFDAALRTEIDRAIENFNSNLHSPEAYVRGLFATGWDDRTLARLINLPLATQPLNMPAPPNVAG